MTWYVSWLKHSASFGKREIRGNLITVQHTGLVKRIIVLSYNQILCNHICMLTQSTFINTHGIKWSEKSKLQIGWSFILVKNMLFLKHTWEFIPITMVIITNKTKKVSQKIYHFSHFEEYCSVADSCWCMAETNSIL